MAYTFALRDHVWFISSDGTVGGVTLGGGLSAQMEKFRTIRWLPAAGTDTITIESFKDDGSSLGVIWESTGGASTAPQESRLDLRCIRGFKIVMTTGGKCYLYEALDGPAGH
jgi:hypothetical protein